MLSKFTVKFLFVLLFIVFGTPVSHPVYATEAAIRKDLAQQLTVTETAMLQKLFPTMRKTNPIPEKNVKLEKSPQYGTSDYLVYLYIQYRSLVKTALELQNELKEKGPKIVHAKKDKHDKFEDTWADKTMNITGKMNLVRDEIQQQFYNNEDIDAIEKELGNPLALIIELQKACSPDKS